MGFKSQLLLRQLRDIFGSEGEVLLRQFLASSASGPQKGVAEGIERLLGQVDAAYGSYAGLQYWQSQLSGDVLSDWNLKTGNIESGRQWKSLLGYGQDELDNQIFQWQRQIHPDDLVPLQRSIAEHVQGQQPSFRCECRMRSKEGPWRWLLLRGVVTARDAAGEAMRMLVLHRDVSEAKETELSMLAAKDSAESANRARGAFLANMSHEIRTPMNGIIGMTELALDTKLDAEQQHYLKTVKSSAEALLTIVNDILDFSKIEAGKMRFETVSFAPGGVVFDSARVLAVSAHKKGLELLVSMARDVPGRLQGDPTRLRQVIINLIGNAVKFTERGEVSVDVAIERQLPGAVYLKFSVRDTGIGVPPDKQQAIFDAFSQADVSTTRRFGGTGLGLAISARLVQMMDGRIWLESKEGEGSVFYFTARFGVEDGEPALAPTQRFAGKRVLVIEDNLVAGQYLQALLERFEMRVSLASDAAAGWSAIEQANQAEFPFDYVIADARMPEPAGFALADIWQRDGRPEKLLLLLNADNQRNDLARLRRAGCVAYLVKPVAVEDLFDALSLAASAPADEQADGEFRLADFEIVEQPKLEGQPLDILVVEDNPVNQELALRLLQQKNHRVAVANNGVEAIEQFETGHFDIILMDMQMPVMGGVEATEAIRSREMRRSWVVSDVFKPVQIIAMTANAMASDRAKCLDAGMNDFLTKPLRPVELFAAIDRATGLKPESITQQIALPEIRLDLRAALSDIGDLDLFVNMASMFLAEWQLHVDRLKMALAEKVQQDVHIHAHTLKSLLAMFHAESARRLALELERMAQGGGIDWSRCEKQFDTLSAELDRIKPDLEQFVSTRAIV